MERNNDAEREARNKANQNWALLHLMDMDNDPDFDEGLAELNGTQMYALNKKGKAKDPDKKLKDNIKTLIILAVLVAALYAFLTVMDCLSRAPM
ncbi:MAG: hypothetical protein IKU17_10370 [Clostridia bacterium]|nr:hypothetical protein [Clostridia bacterium]